MFLTQALLYILMGIVNQHMTACALHGTILPPIINKSIK